MARKPKFLNEYGERPQHSLYQRPKIPFGFGVDGIPDYDFVDDLEENHHGGGGYGVTPKEAKKPPVGQPDEKLARLATEFVEAFNASSDQGKEGYFRQIMQQTGHGHLLPPEPSTAVPAGSSILSATEPARQPVQWLDRADDDKRTPPEFIRDEYAGRKGLTRADIRRLDEPLYRALAKWLRANPMPDWLDLPNQKQLLDQKIKEYAERGSAEGMSARDYLRVRNATARRPHQPN